MACPVRIIFLTEQYPRREELSILFLLERTPYFLVCSVNATLWFDSYLLDNESTHLAIVRDAADRSATKRQRRMENKTAGSHVCQNNLLLALAASFDL